MLLKRRSGESIAEKLLLEMVGSRDLIPSIQSYDADICIIGSGIAGSILSLRLVEKGFRCLLLEAGGRERGSESVTYENIGRSFGLRSTRSIQLGGTSNLWHGVLSPLDPIDFKKRSWIPHSGWPIERADLEPFYRDAAQIFGLSEYDYYDPFRLPPHLSEYLDDLRFDRNLLQNKMFQQPLPPKSFRRDLEELETKKMDSFRIMDHSVALCLNRDGGGRIRSVLAGLRDGRTKEVRAKVYVVCAGALETPRLLLNSGIEGGAIGKFLMDHPMGNLCQVQFKEPQKAHIYSAVKYRAGCAIKSGLVLKDELQEKWRVPNHNFYMRPSFKRGIHNESEKIKLSLLAFKDGRVAPSDIWRLVRNLNVVMQILSYKFSLNATYRYADLFFVTEQVPNPNSSVALSSQRDRWGFPIAKVNWQISSEDLEGMQVWSRLLREEALGEDNYDFTHRFEDIDWDGTLTSAAHHVGTARMGQSPHDAVVDKDLKVFGVDNLYVCDGAVFTTAGNVNNGLTIAALAVRLADSLKRRGV